ncbi:MAG: M24 family metallopeptidase, partial [Bacteroidales bacterium]|nr:M24 family metallopeptidase [Bacteroidales bacterium]
HAFEPIVASGKNALVLHYVENNGMCKEGDLLLMDFGAEVNNYAADCTRSLPVGGRFSDR